MKGNETMTPVQIRQTMNETIDAYRRSHGETRKANAKLIVAAMKAYPWLADQVPYEVARTARELAK